ncbi:MAG: hypothetical protein BWY70_00834 [Bacteroidetes bacterium ADurb.Bin408]|nr:MAG: hypothetical protein BWY70_00834 [Bacteroidetes bacterium ADurb.Bin408]
MSIFLKPEKLTKTMLKQNNYNDSGELFEFLVFRIMPPFVDKGRHILR